MSSVFEKKKKKKYTRSYILTNPYLSCRLNAFFSIGGSVRFASRHGQRSFYIRRQRASSSVIKTLTEPSRGTTKKRLPFPGGQLVRAKIARGHGQAHFRRSDLHAANCNYIEAPREIASTYFTLGSFCSRDSSDSLAFFLQIVDGVRLSMKTERNLELRRTGVA